MDYRRETYNDNELQTDTIENKNRKILANVLPYEEVPNKPILDEGTPNYKTTFRDVNTTVDENTEDKIMPGPVFAYGGTDKGVNDKQWGSS